MLDPMEYHSITITLSVDYNRSITHIYMYAITEAYIINITATYFQITLAKCPTTLILTL